MLLNEIMTIFSTFFHCFWPVVLAIIMHFNTEFLQLAAPTPPSSVQVFKAIRYVALIISLKFNWAQNWWLFYDHILLLSILHISRLNHGLRWDCESVWYDYFMQLYDIDTLIRLKSLFILLGYCAAFKIRMKNNRIWCKMENIQCSMLARQQSIFSAAIIFARQTNLYRIQRHNSQNCKYGE